MISALVVLLCSQAALGQASEGDMNASQLRNLVVNSSADLQSYRFSMQMDHKIDMINASSGEVDTAYLNSLGRGAADMARARMKLSLAALSYVMGDDENATAIALDEYMVNDTVYLKMNGEWSAMNMGQGSDPWSSQSNLEQQIELFSSSNLTLIGSESVEGRDCYKVAARIDPASAAGLMSEQLNSVIPMGLINLSSLLGNMSLDAYYWIAKDTHTVMRTDIMEDFVVDLRSMGLSEDSAGQEMRVSGETSMLFYGFNESINITLPQEAEDVQASPLGLLLSSGSDADEPEGCDQDEYGGEVSGESVEFDKNAL